MPVIVFQTVKGSPRSNPYAWPTEPAKLPEMSEKERDYFILEEMGFLSLRASVFETAHHVKRMEEELPVILDACKKQKKTCLRSAFQFVAGSKQILFVDSPLVGFYFGLFAKLLSGGRYGAWGAAAGCVLPPLVSFATYARSMFFYARQTEKDAKQTMTQERDWRRREIEAYKRFLREHRSMLKIRADARRNLLAAPEKK